MCWCNCWQDLGSLFFLAPGNPYSGDSFGHFSIHGYGCWKCFRRYSEHLWFLEFLDCFPWPFKSFLASFWPKQDRLLHDLGEGPGDFTTPESHDCSMEGSPRSVNHRGNILDFIKKEGFLRMLRIWFIWLWLKEISGLPKMDLLIVYIYTVHLYIFQIWSQLFSEHHCQPSFCGDFDVAQLDFDGIFTVRYWSLESLLGSHPSNAMAPLLTGEEA